MGCRLQAFHPAWAAITDDAYVLSIIRGGLTVELSEPLPAGVIRRHTPPMPPLQRKSMAREINALLRKGVIEATVDYPRLCLSPVFLVPKRSGNFRMILNLKRINLYIESAHFRMETLASILPYLRPGDWAVSIDLKDAYHHVPIAIASRNLLGFTFEGSTYRFRALPFGLKPAPRVFTRLVGCVAAFLRQRGLRIFCYLDDWLLVASSPQILRQHLVFLLRTVQGLGFLINWDKSELIPTQHPSFLGAAIDIPGQLARPSPGRVATIVAAAGRLRVRRQAPARVFLQFLGYLASLVDVLTDCRLRMRPLQLHFLRNFRPGRDPLCRRIPLPPTIRLLLRQWCRRDFLQAGKPLRVPLPSVTVTTDASHMGWGGHCLGHNAFGDWPRAGALPHINVLEFRAVILSLHQFLPLVRHRTVLIRTDNITVAAYINKQGGTRSTRLNALAAELWTWCRRRDIIPTASYIPGRENLIADFLSRGRVLPSEWTIHRQVLARILRSFGPLDVDLFASALNARLPRYCTKALDPRAWRTDAFSFRWEGFRGYAFPPIALIPKVLLKVRQDQAFLILIAPWWPKRTWFLEMTSLIVGYPRLLPNRRDVISQPISGTLHHRPASLHLTAWPLSGRPSLRQAFLSGLPASSQVAAGNPPGRLTIPVSPDSSLGAKHTRWIPVQPL